jgi:anti-sigma factor RsiW
MNCSTFDLRDYLLQELADPQRLQVEAHVQACPSCQLELDRLRLTQTALFTLRDEEIPQRIGFVSDPVFEPSPWRRGWAAFWGSAARLGFASAAMLSVALVVFSMNRPAPPPRPVETAATVSSDEIRQRLDAAIETGVARATAVIEARYAQRTEQLVKDIESRDREERRNIQKVADLDIDYLRHSLQAAERKDYVAANRQGEPQ